MKLNNKDEEQFLNRVLNSINKAINNNQISSFNFLDERMQSIINFACSRYKDIFVYMDGGYSEAEYRKCIISSRELNDINFKIDKLKIDYNKRFLTINHRSVLGALMSLGIKREVVGDIIIGDTSYILCNSDMSDYIISQLKTIYSKPVTLIKCSDDINSNIEYEYITDIISSLRLDCVISSMFDLSRLEAKEYITKELVKVNHSYITNPTYQVKDNDLISVRKKSRMRFVGIKYKTKKDKIVVEYCKNAV